MNSATLVYTALSILGFGLWGFLMKLGQQRLGALPHLAAMGLVVAAVVLAGLLSRRAPLPPLTADLWIPAAATLATLLAMLFLVLALEQMEDHAAGVVALSALYPGITALLSTWFLGETFSWAKIAGLAFAALAAILFTR